MMARFMALSQDNRVAQLVSRMLENKLLAWPSGRPMPEPLRDESFLLPGACLVQARAPGALRLPFV
jgi:hypothetical protein